MLIKAFLTDKKQMSLEEAAEKLDFLGETNEDSVVKSKVSAGQLTSEPKALWHRKCFEEFGFDKEG